MDIHEIIKNVAIDLTKMYHETEEVTLVFPRYRENNIRISEQESKILFSKYFFENKIAFSVEAPTKTTHCFSGQKLQSASSDMLTYKNKDTSKIDFMIELKKGIKLEEIRKDFEKMIVSNENCLWFQTLENRNGLTDLLKRMNEALDNEKEKHVNKHTWIIAIIILGMGELYKYELSIEDKTFKPFKIDYFSKETIFNANYENDLTNGKSMIYAPEINDKTFLHFSWGKGSGHLRNYSKNVKDEPVIDKGKSIQNIRSFIIEEIVFSRRNSPDINNVEFWHKKTMELNREYGITKNE